MQELPPEAAFRAAPFLPRYCGKFLQRKYFVAGPPVCGDFFAILQEVRRPGKGGATKHTMNTKTYPRTNDRRTIYLNTVIDNPYIEVGDYAIYNDFVNDPAEFEKNNVLYHYPDQQGPAGHRQILLHRLRGKIHLQRRQPRARQPLHLSIPHLF